MKTICLVLFAFLGAGTRLLAGVVPQADTNEHKPCFNLEVSPASEEDAAAFKGILNALQVDPGILLYVSHDPKMKNYGGAMSFRCPIDNHEIYQTDENWTIYDPALIQGDAARDFVFAHEIAHHINGDTSSGRPRNKELELRADYNGVHYLMRLGWTRARLLHALDLLDLAQSPQPGYPTLQERKAAVEEITKPSGLGAPTNLQGTVVSVRPPTYEESFHKLLSLNYEGFVRFQSVRTNKYVCAIATPDPKIPSTSNFAFFDNCESDLRASFDLRVSPDGNSAYWIQKYAEPCPEFAVNCRYVLKSVGHRLQFWNQNLAADKYGWEKELGEQELFNFESSDSSEGLVRIKVHKGGYVFVDPATAELQSGGSREQAAEFKVLLDSN
jgi:hypothetical protein